MDIWIKGTEIVVDGLRYDFPPDKWVRVVVKMAFAPGNIPIGRNVLIDGELTAGRPWADPPARRDPRFDAGGE